MSTLIPVAEGASPPERCIPPWRVMLAVSFGAFLTSFDAGAINAVLPLIRHAFARGIGDVQWVLAADLLVASGLLLIFGGLGDRFGPRPAWMARSIRSVATARCCGSLYGGPFHE